MDWVNFGGMVRFHLRWQNNDPTNTTGNIPATVQPDLQYTFNGAEASAASKQKVGANGAVNGFGNQYNPNGLGYNTASPTQAQGIIVVSLNMAGSVPDEADLVVTDPVQAGVMTVMLVARTAKFDIRRQRGHRY